MSLHKNYKIGVPLVAACALALQIIHPVNAAITDITNTPLFTSSVNNVKSNIMFILDDSGSMDYEYLPDDAQKDVTKYGFKSYQCNGVAYNPSITYAPPIKSNGTFYGSSSFTNAKSNGFSTASGGSASLSNSSAYYYKYTGSQTALSYDYSASSALNTLSTFYKECNSSIDSSPGNAVFEKIDVTTASTAVKQNYANWYTYYRTRLLMMKSSVGLAFSTVDSKYRVGFNVINNQSASGTKFLDILDFDINQKNSFYTTLYSIDADPYTPLRGALSRAGQYFANKASGQTVDPIQYSCQKNFSILSTDGYWNTNNESTSAPKFGPYQVDNDTEVGQQDADAARPMRDGYTVTYKSRTRQLQSQAIIARVTKANSPLQSATVTPAKITVLPVQMQTTTTQFLVDTYPVWQSTGGAAPVELAPGTNCTIKTSATTVGCSYSSTPKTSVTAATCSPAVKATNGSNGRTWATATVCTQLASLVSGFADVPNGGSCTVITAANAVAGVSTQCRNGTAVTTNQTGACSASTRTGNNNNNSVWNPGITCTAAVTSSYTAVVAPESSCTPSATTLCKYGTATSTTVDASACTAVPADFNALIATTCTATTSRVDPWVDAASCTTSTQSNCQYAPYSALLTVDFCTTVAQSTSSPYTVSLATDCQATASGGSTNSLADVAMYYYQTDLRDTTFGNCTGALGSSVCENNVSGGGRDISTKQHMTTFTLGLGNSGTLKYDPKYLSQSSGDYFDIVQGTKRWPIPNGNAANIDDLWHAAVNGRGQFFSASEPQALSASLNNALDSIKAITGSASSAATSTLQPVQGNNDIYVAQFTSAKWTGDVLSYKIEPNTGVVATTTTWSAQARLDAVNASDRKIYYQKSGTLRNFTYANLTTDAMQGNFDNFCSKRGAGGTASPIQCSSLNTADTAIANGGENLVNYLHGTQSNANDLIYRSREHVLGDIINASPLFIGKPSFKYSENGYGSFASGSTRSEVIYTASNDGMLHAFDKTTGNEKWAYIPSFVIPNLYKLADTNYPNNHVFMVDGSPVSGDIYVNSSWKTILIGGLNSGGRGYYALDITDPEAPKVLWEFSETDLGYTFGNPIITKKTDGTWVVIFSSGYNNVSPGDGNGHLYMLNANTGEQLLKIDTNVLNAAVGSTDTPSGLSKINVYVDADTNNVAKTVYGGDLLGNVWRFDINSSIRPYLSAMRLAELKIGTKPQSITTSPAVAEVTYNGAKYKVVYVGTGKYLGTSDLANTDKQTIYALKDSWTETGLGDVRTATSPAMVVQTASAATSSTQGSIVKGTARAVNWTSDSGWYMDFISSGERVSINPILVLNSLYVGTNVPKSDACTVGGTSWLYKLDIAKGSAIAGSSEGAIATSLGNVLIMGMTNIQLTTRTVVTIVTGSDGNVRTVVGAQPSTAGSMRRTSWRILK